MHAAVAAGNNYSIGTRRCSCKDFVFEIAYGRALDLFKLDAAFRQQATDGFGTLPGTSPARGWIYKKWDGAVWVAQSAGVQMLQCATLRYKVTCLD